MSDGQLVRGTGKRKHRLMDSMAILNKEICLNYFLAVCSMISVV
jgi:hypothetical protein